MSINKFKAKGIFDGRMEVSAPRSAESVTKKPREWSRYTALVEAVAKLKLGQAVEVMIPAKKTFLEFRKCVSTTLHLFGVHPGKNEMFKKWETLDGKMAIARMPRKNPGKEHTSK